MYHVRVFRVRAGGSLREYIVHFRYKWLIYYVRMSKDVVWDRLQASSDDTLSTSETTRAPWPS